MEAYDNQFNFNFNPNYDECTHRVQYFENQHCANQNQYQYFNNTNINIEENPSFIIPLYDPIIKFNIRFSTGQRFTVQDYPYNLFKSTYDKFIKEQCPVYFKDKIPIYNRLSYLKTNIDILTGQTISNRVLVRNFQLTKIFKPISYDKSDLFD